MLKSELYFVILNYNSSTDTVSLYLELLKQGFVASQIIVVDNNSKSEDKATLRAHISKQQLHLLNTNKGYAAGNFIGVQEAIKDQIPFVLLLNPDIRLSKTCVNTLYESIKQKPKAAVIGPRICFRNTPNRIYSDGGILRKEAGYYTDHKNTNKLVNQVGVNPVPYPVDYVNGSVFFARTEVFKTIGFMKSVFFLYFEETEWCSRVKQNGFEVLVDNQAVAYHESSEKGGLYFYYMIRNRLLLSRIESKFFKKTLLGILRGLYKELLGFIKKGKIPNRIFLSKCKGLLSALFLTKSQLK